MDELEISGRRYISSARAAKEHKYHSDYIGQLVRGGKVAGQKVGRAWYVDADSLAQYLGKEVPARGPIKRINPEDGSEVTKEVVAETVPEPVVEEIEEVAPEVKMEGSGEKSVAESDEVRDISPEPQQKRHVEEEANTDFIMPMRKSGRHHTIAAIDSKQQQKNKEVVHQELERKYETPAIKEVAGDTEEPFMRTFNSEEDPEQQTFIPLKITKEAGPEDSFYKVSPRSLRYVSQSVPLPTLQKKAKERVVEVAEVNERPAMPQRVHSAKNFGMQFAKVAVVLVVAGALSLGAGVVASYYLHSITTIGDSGQTSSIILSQ